LLNPLCVVVPLPLFCQSSFFNFVYLGASPLALACHVIYRGTSAASAFRPKRNPKKPGNAAPRRLPLPSVDIHCSPSTSAITTRAIGAVDATKENKERGEGRGKRSERRAFNARRGGLRQQIREVARILAGDLLNLLCPGRGTVACIASAINMMPYVVSACTRESRVGGGCRNRGGARDTSRFTFYTLLYGLPHIFRKWPSASSEGVHAGFP